MEHIDELGSLARPDEDLRAIVHEEHETWERQVVQKREANFLFAEMTKDKLSGQLPFHEVSDEEVGERMLYRARAAIHAFTEQARQAGTFQDQFLGAEAAAGFKLLDVLARKYDVVAANPPYMGTTQASDTLLSCISSFQESPDLYGAFLSQSLFLLKSGGTASFLTRADYLTQSEAQNLRHHLLGAATFLRLVRLGSRTFRDLSNPNAMFFAMAVFRKSACEDSLIAVLDVSSVDYEQKGGLLRENVQAGLW